MVDLKLNENEAKAVRHALEVYLANLRGEITKTERHGWKTELHGEEDALKATIEQIKSASA